MEISFGKFQTIVKELKNDLRCRNSDIEKIKCVLGKDRKTRYIMKDVNIIPELNSKIFVKIVVLSFEFDKYSEEKKRTNFIPL